MRNRLRSIALGALAVTMFAAPAAAQNTNHGEFSILFWQPTPEIVIQSGSVTAATGITDIDFVETFGIAKDWFPTIKFTAGRAHKFRFSYVPVKYEADTTISRTITFQGRTFTVGVPASTDIKWDIFGFGYEWDFVSKEMGYVGVIADLKYNKMEASITSTALTSPAATKQNAPIPTIGVAGRGYVHPMVAIGGEFSGLKVKAGDIDAKFFDFDINGIVTFGRYVGVQGGYRAVTVDYIIDDDTGDLKLKGPYIGGIVKF
jgi:hypothetical protein